MDAHAHSLVHAHTGARTLLFCMRRDTSRRVHRRKQVMRCSGHMPCAHCWLEQCQSSGVVAFRFCQRFVPRPPRLGSKATVAWMRSICHRVACRLPVPLDQMRQRHREAPNQESTKIRTAVAKHGTHPNSKNDFSHASDAGAQCTGLKVTSPTRCSRGRQIDFHAIPRPKARDIDLYYL